jgi:hypothetical protein
MRRLSPHLSYANVMATIAVFIALGGSAVAAATITGRDIQDGTVSGRDIKKNTLQSSNIKDGTLRKQDFFPGVLSSATGGLTTPLGQSEGATGATGATGPQGPQGERGAAGADGKDGAPGKDGKNGLDGKDGIDGQDGAPGAPGTPGTPGTNGTNGTNGQDGTAVAYATYAGGNVFDNKGVQAANITNPAAGVYCFKNLPFSFKSMVVVPYGPDRTSPNNGNWDKFTNVYFEAGTTFTNTTCGNGIQAEVTTYDVGQAILSGSTPANGLVNGGFVVWFDN